MLSFSAFLARFGVGFVRLHTVLVGGDCQRNNRRK